ncbi:MAG: prolyl oligopeptidase family serine peptidase [Acidiferrobacterales bacterium]
MRKKTAPCGSWCSPLSAQDLASASISFGDIVLDGEDVYWNESRPSEEGRSVIVCQRAGGEIYDITPDQYNVRSRVHEYGGGAFTVGEGSVYFVNNQDQQIYQQEKKNQAQVSAITTRKNCRYADLQYDKKHKQLICIEEDHSNDKEVINRLVAISLSGDYKITVFASGRDFYASPVLNPACTQLAWLSWDHPDMPWENSKLWCAGLLNNGSIGEPRLVAGGENISVFQPQWSPTGELFFVSDQSGWWNLYREANKEITCLVPVQAEFGLPQWVFAMSTYAFLDSTSIICCYNKLGTWHLAVVNIENGKLTELNFPFVAISGIRGRQGRAVFIGSTNKNVPELVKIDGDLKNYSIIKKSSNNDLPEDYISLPEKISFATGINSRAHGFFYKPVNGEFSVAEGELPPLLVKCHGGPTAATTAAYNQKIQYWTSRGFAVLDVNYRGSTGYGRAYRLSLAGLWGLAEVEDCVRGAQHLAAKEMVDVNRLAISGSSAGGYTVLCALTFYDVFKTGASLYGISELEALAKDTHKFESRYMDKLVGPYPADKKEYFNRSPVNFTDKLSSPIAFFQGSEDKVVPPSQAEMMVNALDKKGLPVAYELYPGEQHGFRKAGNIIRALEGELYFYAKIFGFNICGEVHEIEIRNLPP